MFCFLRDVVSDGGAAGQTRSSAAGVQEETSGSHRHVELRCQGTWITTSSPCQENAVSAENTAGGDVTPQNQHKHSAV